MDVKEEIQLPAGADSVKRDGLSKRKKELIFSSVLVFVSILWGLGFVVQSIALDTVEPFTFNGARNLLACFAVLPVALVLDKTNRNKPSLSTQEKRASKRELLKGGALCGVFLFLASSAQQVGLIDTSPGKAGFITTLYIVLVPIIGMILGKKTGAKVWVGICIAVVGLYLLCVSEDFTVQKSDLMVLLCSFFYALHIVTVDHFSARVDGVKLACIQFLVTALLSFPVALLFETPSVAVLRESAFCVFYMGVFSCGVAFTLQIVAQKHVNPTVASLLMSLESVFSVIFSWLILKQGLSSREGIGVLLMMVAVVLAQLPERSSGQWSGRFALRQYK